jgi:hypothetical protein
VLLDPRIDLLVDAPTDLQILLELAIRYELEERLSSKRIVTENGKTREHPQNLVYF